MTSWLVLVYNVEHIFEYVFWIVNYLVMELGQFIDIALKILHDLENCILNPGPF